MKSNNCFSRKGFIKPIWLNNIILWILIVLSYALFDFILVNTHDLTALENAVCVFGLCMGVFFIIDCFSYVKIDADKKAYGYGNCLKYVLRHIVSLILQPYIFGIHEEICTM